MGVWHYWDRTFQLQFQQHGIFSSGRRFSIWLFVVIFISSFTIEPHQRSDSVPGGRFSHPPAIQALFVVFSRHCVNLFLCSPVISDLGKHIGSPPINLPKPFLLDYKKQKLLPKSPKFLDNSKTLPTSCGTL